MQDCYAPDPVTSAECPHCRQRIGNVVSPDTTLAVFTLRCRACAGLWDEYRDRTGITRAWAPRRAANPVPGAGPSPAAPD